MAAFDDFMAAFNYNADTFNEEQFKAAALSAYQEDTTALTGTTAAKDAEIAERDARIKKLGEDNWKLLMKQGPPVDTVNNTSESSGDTDDPKPKSIDQMFKKVERKA